MREPLGVGVGLGGELDVGRGVDGLGLDSIDALELGLALQKRYGVSLSAESEEVRAHFASVKTLAAFVTAQGKA